MHDSSYTLLHALRAHTVTALGHVVLYVRALEPALAFYRGIVGLELIGRIFDGQAAMLSGGGTHHELLLIEVGARPGRSQDAASACIT